MKFKQCAFINVVIIVDILIFGSKACNSRTPQQKSSRPPTTKRTNTMTSNRYSTTPGSDSVTKPSAGSRPTLSSSSKFVPSTTGATTTLYNLCISTSMENLTIDFIEKQLEILGKGDILKNLLLKVSTEEAKVFIKVLGSDGNTCSAGYLIKINNNKDYHYHLHKLNDSSTKQFCESARTCMNYSVVARMKNLSPPTKSSTDKPLENTPAPRKGSSGASTITIVIPIVVAAVVIIAVAIILGFWYKKRGAFRNQKPTKTTAEHFAGPVNGDVYTVANPTNVKFVKKEKETDLVYTELSHERSENGKKDISKEDNAEYSDITHVLKAGEETYQNVAHKMEDGDSYSNVKLIK
ncbi:uncharacterized protein LOC124446060 isoform X2 [Xenia sp. Carnegie-2017]|uniref:uncharacterized protein LOC124446060 isoform X2 n=1 Tax=Xenia sp. Carnegie-2017 TaxID=2897299 RepID=UPI001F043F31|nr:uncharacterized protein LOC124446060 isoform X2 [Xenia sp. Carnegie-2017]